MCHLAQLQAWVQMPYNNDMGRISTVVWACLLQGCRGAANQGPHEHQHDRYSSPCNQAAPEMVLHQHAQWCGSRRPGQAAL